MTAPAPSTSPLPARVAALDAYRGLVLALMMGEALHFCRLAAAFPASALWAFLCHHQDHVEWVGCSLHDLIQPGFSFLVGAALPYSLAARGARGQSRGAMVAHAFRRALILVVLGVLLRSLGRPQTYFTFEDTLTQIGLGYGFLFLLALRPRRDQWIALALILVAFWAAFALYPAPGRGFEWESVGVPSDWPHLMTGFAAHWSKNENFSAQFDRWSLNLFPREQPFAFNEGGYQTLSFIPTLGTMILGLLAGGVLRSEHLFQEGGGGVALVGDQPLLADAGIHEQTERQGEFRLSGEIKNFLRLPVFADRKVRFVEIRGQPALAVANRAEHVDHRHVYPDGRLRNFRPLGGPLGGNRGRKQPGDQDGD